MMAKDTSEERDAEIPPPINIDLPPIDAEPEEIARALVRSVPRRPKAEEPDE